jgi:hypothetical protein
MRYFRRADFLLSQMYDLTDRYRAFNQPILLKEGHVLTLLRSTVEQKGVWCQFVGNSGKFGTRC